LDAGFKFIFGGKKKTLEKGSRRVKSLWGFQAMENEHVEGSVLLRTKGGEVTAKTGRG